MPSRDRAEYMRDYRKRMKLKARGFDVSGDITVSIRPTDGEATEYRAKDAAAMIGLLIERITFLENEVARLKRELAARPDPRSDADRIIGAIQRHATSFGQFRPVPKPGKK